jgi:hypothetical protein
VPAFEALDCGARARWKDEERGKSEQDKTRAIAEEDAKRLERIQRNAECDGGPDYVNLVWVFLLEPDGLRPI